MKLLITGASGSIGRVLRDGLAGQYELMRLTDLAPPPRSAARGEECVGFDITDLDAATAACAGIDCVVHLAGIPLEPKENAWEQLLPANIVGCYNMFEASRRSGVRRFIFASSNHVVGFYRREVIVDTDVLPRPDSLYGAGKVFGEALGRLYADKHGMSVACLRIGSFRPAPEDRRQLATWVSAEDTVQLIKRCIDAPSFHFFVVYGVSNNEGTFWTNRGVEWLGYEPHSCGDDYAERFASHPPEDALEGMFHGGGYCAQGFDGDPSLID
ncbi:MAG: NAD(P)-dependent oxidoreductase [Caulobacteraceae bacterium]|nr:NAD(P)-dependent oxidoreductase [Caulobacteraceae bacterium]